MCRFRLPKKSVKHKQNLFYCSLLVSVRCALCRTNVRRRVRTEQIYLPFSASAGVTIDLSTCRGGTALCAAFFLL